MQEFLDSVSNVLFNNREVTASVLEYLHIIHGPGQSCHLWTQSCNIYVPVSVIHVLGKLIDDKLDLQKFRDVQGAH